MMIFYEIYKGVFWTKLLLLLNEEKLVISVNSITSSQGGKYNFLVKLQLQNPYALLSVHKKNAK